MKFMEAASDGAARSVWATRRRIAGAGRLMALAVVLTAALPRGRCLTPATRLVAAMSSAALRRSERDVPLRDRLAVHDSLSSWSRANR